MKLDQLGRKDFAKETWRLYSLYAEKITARFYQNEVHIIIKTKDPVEVDGIKYLLIHDSHHYDEVPPPT